MTFMPWEQSYNIGISTFDAHHQHLVKLLNKSYVAIRMNNKQEIAEILKQLSDYAVFHFNTEELMMKKHDFPGSINHEQEHDSFKRQVAYFMEKLQGGEALFKIELVVFLKNWLREHILNVDRECADYLIGKGVS